MNKIELLDCTLRDGGYANNWDFGEDTIRHVIENLWSASIKIIECGFLSNMKKTKEGQSIYSTIEEAEKYCSGVDSNSLALMINCGEYLRFLENGIDLHFSLVESDSISVDTVKDLEFVRGKMSSRLSMEKNTPHS